MTSPKVHLKKEPFPHVIIEDFYNEHELSLIFRELDFLTSPDKLQKSGNEFTTPKDPVTGLYLSNNYNLSLDLAFPKKNISDILVITDKIFNPELLKTIASIHPLMGHLFIINKSFTNLRYYENNEYYKAHRDRSKFTSINYFFKEPKAFNGGDLCFDEFNYIIPIKNNMMVFFGGGVLHSSTEITMNNDFKFSGLGKYALATNL